MHVGEEVVQPLEVSLHMLLHSLSLAFPLLPDSKFRLKVCEALLDQFDIQYACHAILILTESLELSLQESQ